MLPLRKMPATFHLKLLLDAVITAHNQCLKNGDTAGAGSMEMLFQKVGLELYARKLIKAAALAPKDFQSNLQRGRADSYDGSLAKRRESDQHNEEEQPN